MTYNVFGGTLNPTLLRLTGQFSGISQVRFGSLRSDFWLLGHTVCQVTFLSHPTVFHHFSLFIIFLVFLSPRIARIVF